MRQSRAPCIEHGHRPQLVISRGDHAWRVHFHGTISSALHQRLATEGGWAKLPPVDIEEGQQGNSSCQAGCKGTGCRRSSCGSFVNVSASARRWVGMMAKINGASRRTAGRRGVPQHGGQWQHGFLPDGLGRLDLRFPVHLRAILVHSRSEGAWAPSISTMPKSTRRSPRAGFQKPTSESAPSATIAEDHRVVGRRLLSADPCADAGPRGLHEISG